MPLLFILRIASDSNFSSMSKMGAWNVPGFTRKLSSSKKLSLLLDLGVFLKKLKDKYSVGSAAESSLEFTASDETAVEFAASYQASPVVAEVAAETEPAVLDVAAIMDGDACSNVKPSTGPDSVLDIAVAVPARALFNTRNVLLLVNETEWK